MDAFLPMLINVAIFVALALPGFILVKSGMLAKEQSAGLSKVLVYVGMPFMVTYNVIDGVVFDGELLSVIGIAAAVGVTFIVLQYFLSRPFTAMEKETKTRGMMRWCSVFGNSGFLGIPLAIAVFPGNSKLITALIVVNIINNVLIYTLGTYLITGDKKDVSFKKAFLNPVLIAFVLGVILNLLKVKEYAPYAVRYSSYFNNLVTPLSMTILGMKLGGVKFSSLFGSWRTYYVSALKLLFDPITATACMFALMYLTGGSAIDGNAVIGVFIAFAVPTGSLASTMADNYGGDTENAVAFTLGSTILSVLTIPLLYSLVCLFI